MLRQFFYLMGLLVLFSTQTIAQRTWVPFLRQDQTPPEVAVLQSDNNVVTFTVQVNGMLTVDKKYGKSRYQRLSIPNSDVMMEQGSPEVPVIVKLIAVPDCDDVNISVVPSNALEFPNYNVCPFPRYEKQKWPDGSHSLVEVFEENVAIYSTNANFPGKYGEIVETGYVRAQKVIRVAIYPVQFNPVRKTLKVFTDFNISLSFANPRSLVNKELGIFRNIMHHAALNYELSGISASTRNADNILGNSLGKITAGSVNRVTDLDLLTDPVDPMPVDYLIITHSSLFNSNSLTTLANHRRDYNGYDVVIVHVDDVDGPPPNYDCVYEFYSRATNYESIRDFIADVHANGTANHTYDGHLGYIVLAGDAFLDDNTTEMVPASRVYQTAGLDPEISGEYLEYGSDYYYACVTQTGGGYDNDQDLMYGRISVGNEGDLSNVVNKIIDYELYSSGVWRNNVAFMSFSPWFFDDDADCDLYFKQMAQVVPQSYYIGYAWRGFAADTEPANGRMSFTHHPTDQVSQVLVPDEADEMWFRRYTGWRWREWTGSQWVWMYGGQYADPANLCGSDEIDDWLYNQMNAGLHTFVYEGHGRQASLGAGEGTGRTIFRANDIEAELSNYRMYPFIISNACATGYFDATAADMGSVDCIAERAVNLQNEGAIGFLGSARTSYTGAFNYVDRYILEAEYNHLSHVMGEAIMESKLRLYSLLYRRQYNLYGDPAVNLFSEGYTISEDLTLSGDNFISTSITVPSGVTLTITPGTTIRFAPGVELTVNGSIQANGTQANPITFTRIGNDDTWYGVSIDNSTTNSSFEYCIIEYSDNGIRLYQTSGTVTVNHCTIENNSLGFASQYSSPIYIEDTIIQDNQYGIWINSRATSTVIQIVNNTITSNNQHGIFLQSGANAKLGNNQITYNGAHGLYCNSNTSPEVRGASGSNWIHNNDGSGVKTSYSSWPKLGTDYQQLPLKDYYGYNHIYDNSIYEIENSNGGDTYLKAERNYWSASEVNPATPDNLYGLVDYEPVLPEATLSKKVQHPEVIYELELREEYEEAINGYYQLITSNQNSMIAGFSIGGIVRCLEQLNRQEEIVPFLEDIINKYPKTFVDYAARDISLPYLIRNQDYKNAIDRVNALLLAFKESDGRDLLYTAILADIYLFRSCGQSGNDMNMAVTYFQELINKAPNSDYAFWARMQLNDFSGDGCRKPYNEEIVSESTVKEKITLAKNHPNPFNPTTEISYTLPKGMATYHVTIKIYDVLGRLVKVLVDVHQSAGTYSVIWDATDMNARSVASGVYFYTLQAGDFKMTKKMMLMR